MKKLVAAILCLTALALPTVVAYGSVDADETQGKAVLRADERADALSVRGMFQAAWSFEQTPVASASEETHVGAVPSESQADPLAALYALMELSPVAVDVPEPVSNEVTAIDRTGVTASSSAHAAGNDVDAQASATAGSRSATVSTDARDPLTNAVPFHAMVAPSAPAAADDTAPRRAPGADGGPKSQAVISQPIAGMPSPAAATLTVMGAGTALAFAFFPGWRVALTKVLRKIGALTLFSRIAQEDVLNHSRRSELLAFVKENPGERVETARRTLGLSNGSMHYHLKVLTGRDLVRLVKDGCYARLYPAGPRIQPAPYVPAQRRRFLELLTSRPGLTQREAARSLGISERMASYHVHTLLLQGLVTVQPTQGRKRLFPVAGRA